MITSLGRQQEQIGRLTGDRDGGRLAFVSRAAYVASGTRGWYHGLGRQAKKCPFSPPVGSARANISL